MTGMMNDPMTPASTRLGIHLFFLAHMAVFGTGTFYLAYNVQQGDIYSAGVIALITYVPFFLILFGVDEILWLVVTSVLGLLMIYGWLEILAQPFIPDPNTAHKWIITDFDKFPASRHILPGTFLVMYEFMLRNLLIDALGARHDPRRNRLVGWLLLAISCAQILFAKNVEGSGTAFATSVCILVFLGPLLSALLFVPLRRTLVEK